MKTFRSTLTAVALTVLSTAAFAGSMVVYKSPTCGCCGEWIKYMERAGYSVRVVNMSDAALDRQKNWFGVPTAAASCHTAIIEGYVVEGHVPIAAIDKLLKEKPKAVGITVPGMRADSPGMGVHVPGQLPVTLIEDAGRTRSYGTF